MELYGLAQRRHMLASMGIDLWVTREALTTAVAEVSLYRDVAVNHVTVSAPVVFEQSEAVIQPLDLAIEQTDCTVKDAVIAPHNLVSPFSSKESAEDVQQEVSNSTTAAHAESTTAIEPAVQFPSFELQAAVLPHCILLLQSDQLTSQQQQLWANIQAAQSGQLHVLKWPFALAHFQDGRGVEAYLHGFLTLIHQEQVLIAVGELPLQPKLAFVQLPGLQQMLEQPLLKRQLWQAMQGKLDSGN